MYKIICFAQQFEPIFFIPPLVCTVRRQAYPVNNPQIYLGGGHRLRLPAYRKGATLVTY
jgi:hypothetical protein